MVATPQDFLMWLKGLLEGHNLDHGLSAALAKQIKRHLDRAMASPTDSKMPPGLFRQMELFPRGCSKCGLGADGKPVGYVCADPECPSAIHCTSDLTWNAGAQT